MDMYGYGTTEQGTIFTFDGSTSFFIVLMFFPLFSPFFFNFFFHGWIAAEICGNADK